jgi:hypothetical protein
MYVASPGNEPTLIPFIEQRNAEARACDPQATPSPNNWPHSNASWGVAWLIAGQGALPEAKFLCRFTD